MAFPEYTREEVIPEMCVKVVAVYPELPIAFPKCGPYMVITLVGNSYKVTYPQSNGTAIVSIKER